MKELTYIGPVFDSSGYGNASRNNVAALHSVGVNLDCVPISFENKKTNMGELGSLVESLVTKDPQAPVRILHCTPENYHRVLDKHKYNIGYSAWETDKLPRDWPNFINELNEVWVPSKHNATIFKNSGVRIPINVIPHAFNVNKIIEPKTDLFQRRNSDEFVFYSIFQWLERKNPSALLKAYLTEFTKDDNVTLILKSFLVHHDREDERNAIKKIIGDIKSRLHMNNDSFPRVLLITDLLTAEEIVGLHASGDCFVLPHRCEGFGIPIAEAMLLGKPTISTNYGGATDFVTHDTTGYLIDYQTTPVYGMPWNIYSGDQNWAEPNIDHLKQLMRHVYENRETAKAVGLRGQEHAREHLSWQTVGLQMQSRLQSLHN